MADDAPPRLAVAAPRVIPEAFSAIAADGYPVRGFLWRSPQGPDPRRAVVVINAATSVQCRYYARFAAYLCAHGFDAVTYDYRGIGESRPPRLRGFRASWPIWGACDFEAVLAAVEQRFPGQPVDVVAHSIGGFLIGFAPSARRLRRIVTIGAQFAYWRDYAPRARLRMWLRWHLAMPALTLLVGYFPGRRLGWLEDTPRGVVFDWSGARARFEQRRGALRDAPATMAHFGAVRAAILALGIDDDDFGTVPAVERALGYFTAAERVHVRIAPAAAGAAAIGHFAFFHDRFRRSLWPLALSWLREGRLRAGAPGVVVRADQPGAAAPGPAA
jgi:predicted alpha/beta hydrolase